MFGRESAERALEAPGPAVRPIVVRPASRCAARPLAAVVREHGKVMVVNMDAGASIVKTGPESTLKSGPTSRFPLLPDGDREGLSGLGFGANGVVEDCPASPIDQGRGATSRAGQERERSV